ncbi:MAG: hypothetical protein H6744_18810 [Deltaproteobacteria bacterium]|nr:hypothetical protein [Deltaproteobacteria bacterium]MCB9788733.1 hypothetical protein [Deltaproteobacteria bacterium]
MRPWTLTALLCASVALALAGGCDGGSESVADADASADAETTLDTTPGLDADAVTVPDADLPPDADPDVAKDTPPAPDADADAVADTDPDAVSDGDAAADVDAGPDTTPPTPCPTETDCDDGLACTIDGCTMPGAVCTWTLQAGTCLINGTCRAQGEADPNNPCRVCDTASPYAWTSRPDGSACDDGNACTKLEVCAEGVCKGEAMPCSDGEGCTIDTCTPGVGCSSKPVAEGEPCQDGDACTLGETCSFGECVGVALDCDDHNPCTDDTCDALAGCVSVPNTAPCEDGDLCTTGDVCAEGSCVTGQTETCDDGSACTFDLCDEDVGCVHLPSESPCCVGTTSICEDGDPCTEDLCDPGTGGCTSQPSAAKCNDDDACTTGDTCTEGSCVGDPLDCDDHNPCTTDGCNKVQGCFHQTIDGEPCDDGIACTTDDVCAVGTCVGDDSACVCVPTFSDDAVKLNFIALGDGGKPGEGLDLDGDATTCAPLSQPCSGGINNSLGALAGFANAPLADAVTGGDVMLLLEVREKTASTILLAAYQGELDASNPGCDYQTQTCAYRASSLTIDPKTCAPLVTLPGTINGTQVVAGGKNSVFPFNLPLGGASLEITLYNVRFEGTATFVDGNLTALEGVLGGAAPKAALSAAVDQLPPDSLPAGIPLALIKSFIEELDTDIDADDDGIKESASLGLRVKAIDATITGPE